MIKTKDIITVIITAVCVILAFVVLSFIVENNMMMKDGEVTVGKDTSTYSNDYVSFSWDNSSWSYDFSDNFPKISKIDEGLEYEFSLISSASGMPKDMTEYTKLQMNKFYTDSDSDEYFAVAPGEVLSGTVSIRTGVLHLVDDVDGDSYVSVVYGLTNGKSTVVFGVTAYGLKDLVNELKTKNFKNTNPSLIESEAYDTIQSICLK